ncbi:MAG: DUF86 domain-containing protein [Eubacteriales bacterium]|jgi:uncharacterized protein with HEPN domain
MKKSDEVRMLKIVNYGTKLLKYISDNNIDEKRIASEITVQWTVTTPLFNIGEQVYRISDETKEEYPYIPWYKISGMRHRLVHNYDDTNWDIVSKVLFEELPAFIKQIGNILELKTP